MKNRNIITLYLALPILSFALLLILFSNMYQSEEEECSICLDSLPKLTAKLVRMILERDCIISVTSSMSDKQKDVPNRVQYSMTGSMEQIEQLRRWVEPGKAWAQSLLAERYRDGVGVEQSYQ